MAWPRRGYRKERLREGHWSTCEAHLYRDGNLAVTTRNESNEWFRATRCHNIIVGVDGSGQSTFAAHITGPTACGAMDLVSGNHNDVTESQTAAIPQGIAEQTATLAIYPTETKGPEALTKIRTLIQGGLTIIREDGIAMVVRGA